MKLTRLSFPCGDKRERKGKGKERKEYGRRSKASYHQKALGKERVR